MFRIPFQGNTFKTFRKMLSLQKRPPEVFCKNRCSEKFRKIHRKTPQVCNFIQNTFFTEHLGTTASVIGVNFSFPCLIYITCKLNRRHIGFEQINTIAWSHNFIFSPCSAIYVNDLAETNQLTGSVEMIFLFENKIFQL